MLGACKEKEAPVKTRKSYGFEVELSTWNGFSGSNTYYRVKHKVYWYEIESYAGGQAATDDTTAVMFVRRVKKQRLYDERNSFCVDTIFFGLNRYQADTLLALTRPIFEQLNTSNVDTVGRISYFQTDDNGGRVMLHINGQKLSIEFHSLSLSDVGKKSAQFSAIESRLKQWFERPSASGKPPCR
ncbi:hypothetical protein ASU33_05950 [Solirubrum puertoriconensis]|uniref:Uncharacterized protein n=1 Tax=Solirubrum puertoriconensis TaxID=1751427 RepID=A0A9X0HJ90_SOLP1|nr:hypothetical protein ASU33_05950 [Solirubrum puertoriconensis]